MIDIRHIFLIRKSKVMQVFTGSRNISPTVDNGISHIASFFGQAVIHSPAAVAIGNETHVTWNIIFQGYPKQ